jgi:ribosomal-protein-alanine N-acetyltransferase
MSNSFTPFPILKTERLTLRQLESSDANEIFALRSNENVNKYLNRKPAKSIEDAKDFIHTINENIKKNNTLYWAITLNGSKKLIGTICLFNFSENALKVEIGYELLLSFQGKGIMHEATSKVIHFAFHTVGINLIEAYTHSQNQSSTKLLERLNFIRDSAADENFVIFKLVNDS